MASGGIFSFSFYGCLAKRDRSKSLQQSLILSVLRWCEGLYFHQLTFCILCFDRSLFIWIQNLCFLKEEATNWVKLLWCFVACLGCQSGSLMEASQPKLWGMTEGQWSMLYWRSSVFMSSVIVKSISSWADRLTQSQHELFRLPRIWLCTVQGDPKTPGAFWLLAEWYTN